MGRYANDTGGGDFQHAPIGTHAARCIRLIDLGTQQGEWQGKPTFKNQVLVMWELPDELMEAQDGGDGQPRPFIVSKFYTNSLSEKANLRKDLTTWRGRDFTDEELDRFDLQSILGHACLLSVVEKGPGKEGVKVAGVMKLPKGQEVKHPVNPPSAFWLDEFDQTAFETLSDGIKKIIQKSPEYQEAVGEKQPRSQPKKGSFDDMDDDIPF
jgi:hypothetical protein